MCNKKQFLVDKLIEANAFWPYQPQSIKENLSDELLIENVLTTLDVPEINILFSTFPKEKIKQVWETNLLPQGEYLFNLNRFLAWFYFDINNDDEYVRNRAHPRTV